MNDELLELQTQLSYQDDSVQQLNDVVTRQQGDIENLRRELDFLKGKMQELLHSINNSEGDEAPPPHY